MAAALDWYLKIDDVHGDATAPGHQAWIEVDSWKIRPGASGFGPGRTQEITLVMVTGPARARLMSAMQSRTKFRQAQLHGVNQRMGGENHGWVDLQVVGIKPGGRNRNMRPLEEVTFQTNMMR